MNAFSLLTRAFPGVLAMMCTGCFGEDAQMQARLADAEERAKKGQAAAEQLKQTVEDLNKKLAEGNGGGAGDPAEMAALKKENERLQELIRRAQDNPSAMGNLDEKAIRAAYLNGLTERREEWKQALADYQVRGYRQPEISLEDIKPFRTAIGIELERGGKAFVAQVPVTADFQGNWTFPSPAEVVQYAKQAEVGGGSTVGVSSSSQVPRLSEATPAPVPSTTPPPSKQDDDSIVRKMGGTSVQKKEIDFSKAR